MPRGLGAHIVVQEPAGVLHEVRLELELLEELLPITRAVAHGHRVQEQESEDKTWGRERGCHPTW